MRSASQVPSSMIVESGAGLDGAVWLAHGGGGGIGGGGGGGGGVGGVEGVDTRLTEL